MADDWWQRQGFKAISVQNPDGSYTAILPSGSFATVFREVPETPGDAEYSIDRLLTIPSIADDFMQVATQEGMAWPPPDWNIGLIPPLGLTPEVATGMPAPRQLSIPAAVYNPQDLAVTILGEIRQSEGQSPGFGPLSPIRMGVGVVGGTAGLDLPRVRIAGVDAERWKGQN